MTETKLTEERAREIVYEAEWRNKKTDPDYQLSTEAEEEYQEAKGFLAGVEWERGRVKCANHKS